MSEYHVPILVPERHRAAVEAFIADLEAMERFDAGAGDESLPRVMATVGPLPHVDFVLGAVDDLHVRRRQHLS